MKSFKKKYFIILFMAVVVFHNRTGLALEPEEILIIVNQDIPESREIALYYCKERGVPQNNILELPLGHNLRDSINREDYDRLLAEPIRQEFLKRSLIGKIKCLLTVYGVPFKVGSRGVLTERLGLLDELQANINILENKVDQLKQKNLTKSNEYQEYNSQLLPLKSTVDIINGKETGASVDSELSMVLFNSYELYRWQPNLLKEEYNDNDFLDIRLRLLMVSRLDGPNDTIAKGLVKKAINAENIGLTGIAYFDSRTIRGETQYAQYDKSLRDLAYFTRNQTKIRVKEEQTSKLFEPNSCPQTALYCGWYSVQKYIDAFDFVDGAIGYHIASFEAVSLHDPNSGQWCPAMLRDGITATLGPVAEPYLHAFPEPKAFFMKLYEGSCLVEAYYQTKPFNSWQFLLIGDPLYIPFKNSPIQ